MRYFYSLLMSVSLVGTTLFSGCGSQSDPAPMPSTGTVNGIITPPGSINTITATNSVNQSTAVVTPDTSGAYSFKILAPGTYTLTYKAASGYDSPMPQAVVVTAGATTMAAAVIVTRGSGNWMVDGIPYKGYASARLLSGTNLVLSMADTTGGTSVEISVNGFNGTTSSFSLPSFTPYYYLGYTSGNATWSTYVVGGVGILTLTSVDASAKRISGDFTANAPLYAYTGTRPTTGTKTVTGSFTNVTYR